MPTPVLVQCAAAAPDSRLWQLVPGVIGAVIGAAAGAMPAYWLARRSSNEIKDRDAVLRQEDARTAATTAMIRLQRITNSLYTLHHQIERTLAVAEAKGLKGAPLWMMLKPIGGIIPEAVRFETRELAVLFKADRSDLANEMMLMSERHFTTETAMTEYAAKRTALGDLMQPDMNGTIGTTMATPEMAKRFGPRMAELDDLATQMRHSVKEDLNSAMALMRSYSKAMQKHFDDISFLQLKFAQTA